MVEIKEEDFRFPEEVGLLRSKFDVLINLGKSKEEAEQLKQQILQNQKLREEIVDAADFYDGKETQIIGKTLQKILDKLGIKDAPKCYSEMLRTDGDRELGRFY